MAKMNSKHKYMYDAAPSVQLLPRDNAALTASFNGAALTLDTLEGYWTEGELADQTFAVVINVTAVDHTTGDEAYGIDLQGSGDGFATSVVLGRVAAIPEAGQYVILVDADTAQAVLPSITQIRLAGTFGGTTPNFTGFAFLAPVMR